VELAYSIAGLAVGFVVGLTGIGGGALMTPILIVGFGIAPVVAVSTDLLYAAITKCGGIFSYARRRLVHYRVVALLLAGSLPSAVMTLKLIALLGPEAAIEQLINLTLGVSLVLTSIAVFLREKVQQLALGLASSELGVRLKRLRPFLTLVAGVVLGVLVTLSSVGAGALGTALLILLYPRMSMPAIVGTDLLHAVLLTAVAGVGHYQMGSVDLALLLSLITGSLPGVLAGSYLGSRLSPRVMQPLMGSLLMAIGLRFVLAG
jgi:uncharacterized membrane protein YfcA